MSMRLLLMKDASLEAEVTHLCPEQVQTSGTLPIPHKGGSILT